MRVPSQADQGDRFWCRMTSVPVSPIGGGRVDDAFGCVGARTEREPRVGSWVVGPETRGAGHRAGSGRAVEEQATSGRHELEQIGDVGRARVRRIRPTAASWSRWLIQGERSAWSCPPSDVTNPIAWCSPTCSKTAAREPARHRHPSRCQRMLQRHLHVLLDEPLKVGAGLGDVLARGHAARRQPPMASMYSARMMTSSSMNWLSRTRVRIDVQ